MTNQKIAEAVMKVDDVVKDLCEVIKQAVDDRRFKLSLPDSREVRDRIDGIEGRLNEAWRGVLQVPIDFERPSPIMSECLQLNN